MRLEEEGARVADESLAATSRPVQRERKHKKADFDAMVLSSGDEEDVPVEKKSKKSKSKVCWSVHKLTRQS